MVRITAKKGVERAGKYLGIRIQLVGIAIDGEEERPEVAVVRRGYAQKPRCIVINRTSRFDITVIRS